MEIEFDATENDWNIRERDLSLGNVAEFDFSTAIIVQDTRKANAGEVGDHEQMRATH